MMNRINSLPEESSSPSLSIEDVRTLVRLAPMLMLVIALGGCKPNPELAACQIETAKIEGILKGVGIDHEPGETGNLQECLVANERVKGVMRGAAMQSDEIKVKLDAFGIDLSFSVPAGKSHPELSEEDPRPSPGIVDDLGADPGPPQNLPEYEEMPTLFTRPTSTGNKDLDEALIMQLKLIFLKYKGVQYAEFLQEATDQFKLLESARNNIAYKKRKYRPRIEELTSLIENRETTIDSGDLLKGDPRRIDLETELAAYKSEKEHLQRASSYDAMWPKPQYQKTEFPPGSGEYIDRLIFDPSQKVKIDLNALYRVTGVYLAEYEFKLKEYEKERERLTYYKNGLIQTAYETASGPALESAKTNFETQETAFITQGEALESGITNGKFKTHGAPTDVPILAGAIRRPASTATPTLSRPIPTRSAQDDLNLLP